ncbi:hypothetical protein BD560DRAFT_447777 [Blakeslea trispora]|nr:hypothetical protein BD560DRAFT_447777 [Blakeslea trispora]
MMNRILTAALLTSMVTLSFAQVAEVGGFVCDPPGTDGYFFAKELTHWEMANESCGKDGILAGINNKNFEIATNLVRNCIGDNAAAWIGTWDYTAADPQVRNCLTLYVGEEGTGGGINTSCGSRRYALCRRKPNRSNSPEFPTGYPAQSSSSENSSSNGNNSNGGNQPTSTEYVTVSKTVATVSTATTTTAVATVNSEVRVSTTVTEYIPTTSVTTRQITQVAYYTTS